MSASVAPFDGLLGLFEVFRLFELFGPFELLLLFELFRLFELAALPFARVALAGTGFGRFFTGFAFAGRLRRPFAFDMVGSVPHPSDINFPKSGGYPSKC
jgi:hypothetical protein